MHSKDEAGVEHFVSKGSAVLIALDPKHVCLLTARHVLWDPDKGYTPTVVFLRFPKNAPRKEEDLGIDIPLIVNGIQQWHGANDADLAVAPLPEIPAYVDSHAINLDDFGDDSDVFQGANVIVFGYPELLGPDFQVSPIARAGIVAWTDPNGRMDHTFLVDANVFSGNSGGPVFHLPTGLTRDSSLYNGGKIKLIGIITSDAYEEAPVHAGQTPVNALDSATGALTPFTAKVLNIGGIGIVEPISKARKLVVDFLDPFHTLVPRVPTIH